MHKVAVLIHGGVLDVRKGFLNACIDRTKELIKQSDFEVTVFYIEFKQVKFSFVNIVNLIRNKIYKRTVDGLDFNIIKSVSFISTNKLLRKVSNFLNRVFRLEYTQRKWITKYSPLFSTYDFLSVHSRECAYIARDVYHRYNIPYYVTWHGSDIHTIPYEIPEERKFIISSIEEAKGNFFVSKALLVKSDSLTKNAVKYVLYNGVNSNFYKYSPNRKKELRIYYKVDSCKVIAFAGTLRDIKNADILPDIFLSISNIYSGNLKFWIMGDGPMEPVIKQKISNYKIECDLLGFIPLEAMPDLINCVDLLVLPSKNEGLPLITIESLLCGAKVVGSDVGGISEAIGKDYCVPLGENFINRFANKCVDVLNDSNQQTFNKDLFSWNNTCKKELSIYRNLL